MDAELETRLATLRDEVAALEARKAERDAREKAELDAVAQRIARLEAEASAAADGLPVERKRVADAKVALAQLRFGSADKWWSGVWGGVAGTLAIASVAVWPMLREGDLLATIALQGGGFLGGFFLAALWWRRRRP